MPWQPDSQPGWVAAFNRSDGTLLDDGRPIDVEEIAAEALICVGRDPNEGGAKVGGGFSDMAGFEILGRALEAEADLTRLGRWATRRYLRRLFDVRLQMTDWLATEESSPQPVVEPIFVLGAPRTGTTALHRLLQRIPSLRAPEGWEFLRPLPAPEPTTFGLGPRVAMAEAELAFPQQVASGLRAIHIYSARMPKECLSAMAFSGRTEEFISRYAVAGYSSWLQEQSMLDAYHAHRSVLQVLQSRMPARTWVLKSPVHLQSIPELLAVYPDARFVVTHRDPTEVLASVSSLVCTLRSAFSDRVDPKEVGQYHLDLYARSLDKLVDHVDTELLPPERTVHLYHRDIVQSPAQQAEKVCVRFGIELRPSDRDAIGVASSMAREDGAGAHHYASADFGLEEVDRTGRFGRYLDQFDLDKR